MSAPDFDRVREIVLVCLDLEPGQRADYLDAVTRDDPQLAEAVRLLLTHESADLRSSLDENGALDEPADEPLRIGRYAIRRRLGAGGMGIVYLGVDELLSREVAIKVLPDWMATHAPALEQVKVEARLLARVNHPHIATIHSLEQDDDRWLLTMERVRGRSLRERIHEGPLPIDEAVTLGRQIASALEAAEAEGVVHRDLKPSNIMLSEAHGVKILDFGLATLVETAEGGHGPLAAADGERPSAVSAGPRTGTMGTPGYMSPEQIQGAAVDSRSDVWALGCVLYESITGEQLFGGLQADRLHATLHAAPSLESLPEETPSELRDLIVACVEKSVDDRPQTTQVRRALDEILEQRETERLRAALTQSAGPRDVALPFQLTAFIGRRQELLDLAQLVAQSRLVTVTGLGGIGKTRLVTEFCRRSSTDRRLCFVELAPVESGQRLPEVIAAAAGVTDRGSGDLLDVIVEHLGALERQLILDNCEHLRDPVATLVTTLLQRCPDLRILTTSRESIGIAGERLYALAPLELPDSEADSPSALLANDATALFTDRARLADPFFSVTEENSTAIARLCRRVDAVPLALELAAALIGVLSPQEILERAETRLSSLGPTTSPPTERHASLSAMLDDSHDRLSPDEQRVFRRLSVFRGGFTLAAAEDVASLDRDTRWGMLDRIAALVRKSLVVREPAPDGIGSRYRLLELVRDYATTKLDEAEETVEIRNLHLSHFADYTMAIRLTGPDQVQGHASVGADEENVQAALVHATGDPSRAELGARVALGMSGYWIRKGRWREARRQCEDAASRLAAAAGREREEYIRLGRCVGEIAVAQGDLESARRSLREAREIAEGMGEHELLIGVLNTLGTAERAAGNLEGARGLYDDGIAMRQRYPNDWDLSGILLNRGVVLAMQGHFEEATDDFTGSLVIKRQLEDERGIAQALNSLGLVATYQGRLEDALPLLEESLAIKRALSDQPGVVTTLMNLGLNALDRFDSLEGDAPLLDRGRERYEEALALARRIGDRPNETGILSGLAWASIYHGDYDEATRCFDAMTRISEETGNVHQVAAAQLGRSVIALLEGHHEQAIAGVYAALETFASCGVETAPNAMSVLSWAHMMPGDTERAAMFLGAAERQRELSGMAANRWHLARDEDTQQRIRRTLDPSRAEAAFAEGREITKIADALRCASPEKRTAADPDPSKSPAPESHPPKPG